jgi:hypothetical protein
VAPQGMTVPVSLTCWTMAPFHHRAPMMLTYHGLPSEDL